MLSFSSMSSSSGGSGEKAVSTCTSANVTLLFCLASFVSLADERIETGVTVLTGRGRTGEGDDGGVVSEDEAEGSGSDGGTGMGASVSEVSKVATASLSEATASMLASWLSVESGGGADVGGGGGGGFLAAATAAMAHRSTMSKILLSFKTVLFVMGRHLSTDSI